MEDEGDLVKDAGRRTGDIGTGRTSRFIGAATGGDRGRRDVRDGLFAVLRLGPRCRDDAGGGSVRFGQLGGARMWKERFRN